MNLTLIEHIKNSFKTAFKTNPILIFSPGRINLIGEHTDYNNGYVFPAAIDKGIISALQKSESDKSSIIALDINERYDFSLQDIEPLENGNWRNYIIGVVAEIQNTGKVIGNFNLLFGGDIPIGAGMSSSAALENSIVFGLNELFNLNFSKSEMIFISQKAEHNYAGVKCGIMDQYASMFGQEESAILLDCESLESKLVKLNLQDYKLFLINTNVKHSLAESAYNERRNTCEKIAAKLSFNNLRKVSEQDLQSIKDSISKDEYQKALYVIQENQRVQDAYKAISQNNLLKFGELFFASHNGLQNQYKVSCTELDFLVSYAKNSKAIIGARMMGGGFGGCTINIIKKEMIQEVKDELATLYNRSFNNDCSFYTINLSEGTKLI